MLEVTAGPALHRLAPMGRLCIWTDEFRPDAEQELVNRLIGYGVMALVAAGPWSPRPRSGRPWWADTIADRLAASDSLRVPALVRIDGTGHPGGESALLLHRLARGPLTIVLTSRDEPSLFGGPALLRESWGPAYYIDHILKRL
jgi:hypothetical protein